ncbi:hypothetical protein AQUCO_01100074v1 [Aquilegia coerulea]|uniref:Uncharacterized protein n=1 Tax=Aquilegia coerulea TaxID=218851 RepID=A0A2G5E5G0_AQUCA|nr:hypothetical protein AQUCO_01100074v1 [Aquilegia coerulea]
MNLRSLFEGDNPLKYTTPLLMLQSVFASVMACITSALFMPFGIPAMVTQILAGVTLGPSILGHIKIFQREIFPEGSYLMLQICGYFGTIIQIFLIGVQMDPLMLTKTGRKTLLIGILVVVVPLVLVSICGFCLSRFIGLEKKDTDCLLLIGAIESMSAFPVIAGYLIELNILNTEFSNVAFSSSMVSGICCTLFMAWVLIHRQSEEYTGGAVFAMLTVYAFLAVLVLYLLRPIIKWMIKRTPHGQAMKQGHLSVVFALVMLTAYISKQGSIEMLFGPFILGIIIPSGPPLGSALVEKFEFFNKWIIMPIFYTIHGTLMDSVFRVPTTANLLVLLIVLTTFTGKFLGAFVPALYFNMSYKDSTLLGLTMNAQGFIEIMLYTTMMNLGLIDHDAFNVMFLSILILTGASAPLVRYLYKSSMIYTLHNKRTIQHLKPNSELCVLGCVYEEENVPSMIHLLKAINPTKESPIYLSIIHFVELTGSATPLIISHKVHRKLPAATGVSKRIVNVFKRYEETNKEGISIHPYTVISHYPSMHNDVCMLALHKRTSLIILPYHKNLASGYIDFGVRTVNCDVLKKSPCSVAILINRGLLGGVRFVYTNWVSYHVAVVFLGGADDREALAHGKRMLENPTIELTVIRFLTTKGNDNDPTERSLDDAMVSSFKFETTNNNRVTYMEEVVEKGLGVTKVFESMANNYELIILGRRHDEKLPLIIELTDWNKCSELGTVGDIFTTSDYGGKATLLVIQQQSKLAASLQSFQDEQSHASYDVEE